MATFFLLHEQENLSSPIRMAWSVSATFILHVLPPEVTVSVAAGGAEQSTPTSVPCRYFATEGGTGCEGGSASRDASGRDSTGSTCRALAFSLAKLARMDL